MLFSLVFVSHHPCSRRASLPLRNLSVRCLPRLGRGAENFLSFRSSLIPRHSPLTTKSFTIRTSKTPLPQLLYNPHLQAPLGSAGNKGLITPLESALTKNSPVSPLESALTKTGGWGYGAPRSAFWTSVNSRGLPPPEMQLQTFFVELLSLPHIQDPLARFAVRSAAFLFFLVTRHSPLATRHSLFSHVLAPAPLSRLRWAYCSCTLNLCWKKKIFSAKPTQHSIISRGACSLSATNTVSTSKARLENSKSSSRNPRKPNS